MEKAEILEIKEKEKDTQTINPLKTEKERKNNLIKLGFLIVNIAAVVFLLGLYYAYCKGIVEIYKSTPELNIVTVLIVIRVGIMLSFCYYMFKKWFAQEKRSYKNIPFLVGAFFYLVAIGKFLDLLCYIYYYSPYQDLDAFFFLIKLRMIFLIFTFLPMLYLGLRPFIYSIGLKRGWNDDKVLRIRRKIVIIYAILFGFFISTAYDIVLLQTIPALMSIFTYFFIFYLFRFAYKHKTFPTIRAELVSLGFLLYLAFAPFRVVLPIFLVGILTREQINVISECLDFITMTVIFLGFVLKPK